MNRPITAMLRSSVKLKGLLTLAVFATSSPGSSQAVKSQSPVGVQKSASHADAPISIGAPLPTRVVSMSPHYQGMNFSAIYEILHRRFGSAEKSEYETEEQFETRFEKLRSLPLYGNQKVGDQYTFVLGGVWEGQRSVPEKDDGSLSTARGAIRTKFDADGQELWVRIPAVFGPELGNEHKSFGWGFSIRETGHHVGQNAYGVKATISENSVLQQTLEFKVSDLSWLPSSCDQEYGGDLNCWISVPLEKARATDGDVRVALGGTLEAPYTFEEAGTEHAATIDSPFDTYEVKRGLFLSPNQLVIFSGRTGEVFAQYSKGELQQKPQSVASPTDIAVASRVVIKPPQPPVHLDGESTAGMIVEATPPTYPAIARAARVTGSVVLHTIIGKDGSIQNVQIISGNEMLRAGALDAVRHWRYKPYIVNGEPVEVDTTITISFLGGPSGVMQK